MVHGPPPTLPDCEDSIGGVVLTFVDVTERKKAEQLLADELRDTTILRKISEKMIPEEDTQSLFQNIVDAAVELMRSDAGAVQLWIPDAGQLQLLAENGLDQKTRDILAEVDAHQSAQLRDALGSGARLSVDFETSEAGRGDPTFLEAGFRCAQATPLIARSGRPIGMLSIYWKQQHQSRERELRLFDLLARQTADAIERNSP